MDPIGGEQHDNQQVVCSHVFVLYSCVGSACNSTAALISEQYTPANQQPGGRSGSTTPIQERDGQLGELVSPKCNAVPVPKPSAAVSPKCNVVAVPKPPAAVPSSQVDDVD